MDFLQILTTFAIVILILVLILVEAFLVKRDKGEEELRAFLAKFEGGCQAILENVVVYYAILAGLRLCFPNHKGFQICYCFFKQEALSVTSETRLERLTSIAEKNIYLKENSEESNRISCRPEPIIEICYDILREYIRECLTDFFGKSNVDFTKTKGKFSINLRFTNEQFEAELGKLIRTKDELSEAEIARLKNSVEAAVDALRKSREFHREHSLARHINPIVQEKVSRYSGILSSRRQNSRNSRQDIIA